MLRKSPFFDFFCRQDETDFESFIARSTEDEHYINWNEFALPHDYGDAEAEYSAIRNDCAICDVSPMRKIQIRGRGAGAFFDRLMTRPVSELPAMRATYTMFCNEDGSLKDDAILYKYAGDDYLLMLSDVDHSPYFESLCRDRNLTDVTFEVCTLQFDTHSGVKARCKSSSIDRYFCLSKLAGSLVSDRYRLPSQKCLMALSMHSIASSNRLV